ncbi:DNA alkylation response protein [Vineibacter terrae]|uniref:DNA alkylation response protein n=1 Tax=Vineibacter terrae TaxID=2586908 RepID=A0A5C8PS21_9HYPH|nr:acyl-CoA dehydrogenase family protein [Vineibacter terrae]TXL79454.1 DNA alkylation response protein [Vineibacter terrae]
MNAVTQIQPGAVPIGSDLIAPDCHGLNFWQIDRSIRDLLGLYLDPAARAHFEPHFDRLGALAGTVLDDCAMQSDKRSPILHQRDRFGRDEDWVEYHPAYREMERIAYGVFGMHAMSRRAGVLEWPDIAPPVVKYTFNYLFAQSEFGLLCPVSATDTCVVLIQNYADAAIKQRFLPGMLTQDMDALLRGAQFMTEKAGGSDVSQSALTARRAGDHWELWGDKWFCSCVDSEVVLLLARCEGAPAGNAGLSLFLMPRHLEDGRRNRYRIARLKDKLGSRSMASGETIMEGAVAYLLGEPGRGLKQMMDQVNLCRLSHGFRAAGMMRRCLNEALQVARHRRTFGRRVIEHPLARRQLLKLMLPTEQALSVGLAAAAALAANDEAQLRILTPLVKYRACRDNVAVATGAMEMRGGNGYIEDWRNAKLVRDAHLGVLWEGTSSVNALDIVRRAVGKEQAHVALAAGLHGHLKDAPLPGQFRGELMQLVDRAIAFAEAVARQPQAEASSRKAATGLYHVASAALMASEGARLGAEGGDARRLLMARLVIDHRLGRSDPFSLPDDRWENAVCDRLFDDAPVSLQDAQALLAA